MMLGAISALFIIENKRDSLTTKKTEKQPVEF
jgi:hypothetical protein